MENEKQTPEEKYLNNPLYRYGVESIVLMKRYYGKEDFLSMCELADMLIKTDKIIKDFTNADKP